MDEISRICPISDAAAARAISPETLVDLSRRIAEHEKPPEDRRRRRWAGRRPWKPAAALAVGLAVVLLVALALGRGSTPVGPLGIGVPDVQALAFTHDRGLIVVGVRDPLADPAKYRAEFAAHHLSIRLQMVPVSPSLVGTVVFFDGGREMTPITARGRCWTGGGGSLCPVGLRIPVDDHGSADIAFGRAARPGERYESTGAATAPGEALHGLRFEGLTVSRVRVLLRSRHVTAAEYRVRFAHRRSQRWSRLGPRGLACRRRGPVGTGSGAVVGEPARFTFFLTVKQLEVRGTRYNSGRWAS